MKSAVVEQGHSSSIHNQIFSEMDLPPCFVNCRATDNLWFARLGATRRGNIEPTVIDFSVPVTPYPTIRLLTDPEFEKDLITIKIVLKESVRPKPEGWIGETESLMRLFSTMLMFIRARIDMGIPSNSALAPEAKRKYLQRLRTGGYFNLIDYAKRTEVILQAFDRRELSVPLNLRKELDMVAVARLFGVNHVSVVPSEELRRVKDFLKIKLGYASRETKSSASKRKTIKKLSRGRARDVLLPWYHLYKCRDALAHDPIPFRPYVDTREIELEVRKWFRKKGSTKELRPNQVVDLLSKSLMLLTDPLTPFLIDLVATAERGFSLPESARDFINQRLTVLKLPALGPGYMDKRSSGLVSLRNLALVYIPTAAACVIAMGTARRKDELDSIEVGKVTTDNLAQFWLQVPVRKLKNRAVGKDGNRTTIPISATVKLAIDVMERLKAASGDGSVYLFDLQDKVSGKRVGLDFTRRLKSFGRWLNICASDDGSETELAAHQFRKFFAITYFYRYRFPSLPALSLHMMHLDVDVTRAYLMTAARNSLLLLDQARANGRPFRATSEDVARLEDFEEVGRGFVFDILLSTLRGNTKLGGTAGVHLVRDLAKLTEQLSVMVDVQDSIEADEALNSLLQRFASSKTFRPHPEGHGFCACDQTQSCLLAANCLKLKSKVLGKEIATFTDVDHAYAEDLTCATCVHHFVLPELWPYWDNEITRCETALEHASGEARAALQERLAGLRDYEAEVTWQWAA